MHALKLNIKDSVFDKIIYFLQNLPKDEVSIVEDKIIDTPFINEDSDAIAYSNHAASNIEEWKDEEEDAIWK